MRKIIYQVWISLDGYAADTDHTTKFFESPEYGEHSDQDLLDYMDNIDTILLGADTYKMFVDFWPNATTDTEIIADRLNSTSKIVFSKSLKEAPWGKWPAAEIVKTNAVEEVKKLKAGSGKDMVLWGSISLAQSFMKENLIDEFHVRIVPVTLGGGTPLFKDTGEIKFECSGSKKYSSGIVLLQYRPIK